ncbi:MAG TPA: hypothetical protein VGM90_17865 [Kofleriaceae bacterium]|jgi:anti-sigma factor RsiW
MSDDLLLTALRDHARVPAPASLHRSLARKHLARPRRWMLPTLTGLGGALAAAVIVLLLVPTRSAHTTIADEAAGDHLRLLVGRDLGVVASDMHQVKPWFAGKLEFVPPITFLGDEDFPLAGGDVAIFMGKKSAEVVYHRRLHVISLFVFQADDVPTSEQTIRGFHVMTWGRDGFGFALVSDASFDELHSLHSRVQ